MAGLLCIGLVAVLASPLRAEQSLFIVAQDASAAAQAIEAAGGKADHLFLPHVVFARLPDQAPIPARGNVVAAHRGRVDPSALRAFGPVAAAAAHAWNRNVMGMRAARKIPVPEPGPILNDARFVPISPLSSLTRDHQRAAAAPFGAGRYETSEFMMGKVGVGIFLLESNGAIDPSTENWTTTRQNQVIAEIQEGMQWWKARRPTANLTFVYDVHLSAQTSYEPISRSSVLEYLWINEVMANLGYTDSNGTPDEYYFERVYSYNNALRNSQNTDWAFAIFVADSNNDSDGAFADGYFAYAYVGGPFFVMTYDNDGYGSEWMAAVAAHETTHIFYGLDEYMGSCAGTDRAGYFNAENGNCESGGSINVSCIMRGQISPYTANAICSYTRLHLGHRDTDGDGIEDILDVPPVSTLNPYSPDPSPTGNITYTGWGSVSALPNLNEFQPSPSTHPDITINKLAGAEYRVNSGPWQAASAADGAFDEPTEDIFFNLALASGTYTIQMRVRDTAGNYQVTPSSDTITIQSDDVTPPSVIITSPAAGATLEGTALVEAWAYDEEGIARVEFIVDSVLKYTDYSAPHEWSWDTLLESEGNHLLSARAVDLNGNSASDTILVVVDNATFDDVPPSASYWTYVEAFARAGITGGCSTSPPLYCPSGPVTRAQMAVFIIRAMGRTPYNNPRPTFADVPATHWAYGYIERMYQLGITGGCATNPLRYCPDSSVTRAQMAVFIIRAMGQTPYNNPTPSFADVPATHWAYGYIERMYQLGITGGCATNPLRYCPDSLVTRAQMAVFMVRAFNIPL